MKQHDVRHDIQRFLSGGAKRTKWRQRVVEYVLNATGDERCRRVERVSEELEWPISRAILAEQDSTELEGTAGNLLRYLCEKLVEAGDVAMLLQVMSSACSRTEVERAGRELTSLVQLRGRSRFMAEFLRLAGSTLEWSMRFALLIQEEWTKWASQKPVDVGSVEAYLRDSGHGQQTAPIQNFVLECVHAEGDSPEFKAWINHLIEGAASSRAVGDVLWAILEIATSMVNTPVLETLERNATNPEPIRSTPELEQQYRQYPMLRRVAEFMFRPRLILTPPHDTYFRRWSDERKRQHAQERERGDRVIEWFESHRDEVVRTFEERCRAIMERPRRALRTGGIDHIDITVAPLRNAGIRAVVLYPEGYAFPDTGVHILVRKETATIMTFATTLSNFELALHAEVVRHKMHFEHRETLAELFRFVAVDILYRIVVGEKQLREKKRWHRTGDEYVEMQASVRRPRFRRLHEGWKASDEARERALATLGWLPSGHTFVREHKARYHGGQLVYDLPTEPVAVYGDDDLFEMGEWS